MGAQATDRLEPDLEKPGWIRQYTSVHQRAPENYSVWVKLTLPPGCKSLNAIGQVFDIP